MKKCNQYDIWDVYEELCKRDTEWKHPRMPKKFKTLYDGWRAKELRHKIHTKIFYTYSWKRRWLPYNDFQRFRDYAMQ